MNNFGTFIDDCLQRSPYSSLELDLLERLLQSLPENIRISFIQAVYLDNLNLSSFLFLLQRSSEDVRIQDIPPARLLKLPDDRSSCIPRGFHLSSQILQLL